MSLPAIPFYFVRHGETEANVAQQVAGWLDSPLTDKGRQQAKHLASIVSRLDHKPTKIIHSDLSRAKDTAYAVNAKLDIEIIEDKDLREHNFGVHEGEESWDPVSNILLAGNIPDQGESYDMFYQRTLSVFSKHISDHLDPILITAHGGFTFQIQRMLGQNLNYQSINIVRNCHLHYFEPWPENTNAPWKVYVFDDMNGEVVKTPADWCPSIVK